MLKYCLDKWNQNTKMLEENLRNDLQLSRCDYKYLVEKVVTIILNDGKEELGFCEGWDVNNIVEIDNGDYQGTLMYIFPRNLYQPSEHEYLLTYVDYGSCSGCDTLMAITDYMEEGKPPTEEEIRDFISLCRHLVCNMVNPYNFGWRHNPEFDTVEMGEG